VRIAVVHSYYSSREPSGENVVVDLQVEALRRAGHDVTLVARRTDDLRTSKAWYVTSAARVATGRGGSPLDEIHDAQPDLVHVHNLTPNLGRTWVRDLDVPMVATLHNYRAMCSSDVLFRDGHACTLCPDTRNAWHGVRHGCLKDSRLATVPMAMGTKFDRDPVLVNARRILTLNDDMRKQYAAIGVAEERMTTLPNFVTTTGAPGQHGTHDGGYWLYVGRLNKFKGVRELVRDWPEGPRLLIVGSGPVEAELAAAAGPTVELLGQRPNAEVRELLDRATGLVFPSRWPEGLPTIYLEALASGLPVLARPESVVGSLVASEGTGLVASESAESLADDVRRAERAFPDLQRRCREVYEARYTEAAWVEAVTAVYREVLAA